ncbi:MAG: transposase [Proteobacteria bacterium]|nr:transposase [Pseudomonadota bacterium]
MILRTQTESSSRRPTDSAPASSNTSKAGIGPDDVFHSPNKLHQFEKYITKVFHLAHQLHQCKDSRREPDIPTFDVLNSLFHAAVLRIPSINALEGDLKEPDFQCLIGRQPTPNVKAFSAEVISNVLDKVDLSDLHQTLISTVRKAERNKVFREGSYRSLRCVAIDGWEPFCSYHRHCPQCLVRKIKISKASGEIEEVDQYYHRYVVALLVGPTIDVVLGIEPLRNLQARIQAGERDVETAEGELTAALRLLDSLHQTYGSFLDAFILDGLYPNASVFKKLDKLKYSAFIVLKKKDQEPLKQALSQWKGETPCKSVDDHQAREHIDFWDAPGLTTLDSYEGAIRVVRAVVTTTEQKKRTWCIALVGPKAKKVGVTTALNITRARWHIENTAFHQWVTKWNLNHVFRHTPNAIMAILLIWLIAFNLLQFFLFRRLRRPRRPADPTCTIRHLVEVMLREVATFTRPIPWGELIDTS